MVELFSPPAVAVIAGGDERIAGLLGSIGEDLERYLALRSP